ncbi:MAG TPA: class I tRNA ligase family protein [Candidatus Paceibacterota bacterium]|nr:class I tRNA ligase family protein [Candidatus Paceibacterota bacterium]
MDTSENNKKKPETAPEKEERILKFWTESEIFQKSLKKDAPEGEYVFYDGPPFATGLPHYGHILGGTMKDAVPKYKTMRGYRVPRNWGWDCHGLPIENLIEKELGLQTKKDIETLGVGKFNEAARASVFRYKREWQVTVPRTGRFVDMENDYKTMDPSFTESVWWVFKNLYDKGLVYFGHKTMHICPRCETTLANFEVSQGYKDITDISLTAKFELVDEPGTFVLAWTTTPWTLPGNVALAVGPEIDYVKIEKDGAKLILAKDRLSAVGEGYKILEEFKGAKLVGKSYKPLFDYYAKKADLANKENGWKICPASFVTTQDGVGVVHIAPAFGEDDNKLGRQYNLPFVQHVGMDGRFRPEVTDFADISVKPKDDHQATDVLIIKNLAARGLLFSKEKIIHSYPHCWRCDTPLLNYAASSWFVDIQKIKSKIVENVKKSNWVPQNIRDKRFINLIEDAPDWNVSRSRYWGAPLPIWKCDKCDEKKVVGSVDELKKGMNDSDNTYFAMRHGESESVANRTISSSKYHHENPLTSLGREQVKVSAEKLKSENIDLIISSPYRRTTETAKIVAVELGIPETEIVFDDRIVELQVGDLDGGLVEDYQKYFANFEERFYKNPPNGENHVDTKNRMMSAMFDIDKKYSNRRILVISHGDPLITLMGGSKGLTPKEIAGRHDEFHFKPAEFRKLDFAPFPHNENYELDLHKHFIDDISFKCSCGGEMKRVPEVFDCWFESGAMPYGQSHYPFENKEEFERNFPAQFIAEGIDQTRGWFYSLMVLSTALFDKPAFLNVIVNGTVLAEDGQKMSKRLKNYPEVHQIMDKYGADSLRYYLLSSPAVRAEDMRFSERGVDEVYKKIILRLYNVYSFLEMYDRSEKGKAKSEKQEDSKNVLDKWIVARLSEVTKEITDAMERYELDRATRPIDGFVDDLSTWYLRRSRDRFKGDDIADKEAALATLRYVIKTLAKLMAPFMSFISEELYQKVKDATDPESVHLDSWPEIENDELRIKNYEKVLSDMGAVRKIVSLGLELRAKANIKVRQPLQELRIRNKELGEEYLPLIEDELNVKNVIVGVVQDEEVALDTKATPELKEEGSLRELVRNLQDMRKKMGLNPQDKVLLRISTDAKGKEFVKKFETELKKSAGLSGLNIEDGVIGSEIALEDLKFMVSLVK